VIDAPGPHRPMPTPNAPAGRPAGATVCTACPLLCEDIVVERATGRFDHLCELGLEAFRDRREPVAEAMIDGRPSPPAVAIAEAAGRLSAARRVMVGGLDALTIEGVIEACNLAEGLGTAVVPPGDDAQPGGATIARCGEITAAWEELRDRADLVIFWGHDPAISHPRFLERFITAPLAHPRRTISLGKTPLRIAPSPAHEHVTLDDDGDDVDLARLLLATLLDRPHGAVPDRLRHAAATLRTAIDAAHCVGIVTGRADPTGISRWSVIELVRALSRRIPVFEIPLDSSSRGPNAAGARAALVWRYGAAGAMPRTTVRRADGDDALLALGHLPPRPDETLDGRIAPRSVIRIAPDPGDGAQAGVWLRCRDLRDEPGTLLRADGRTIELSGSPEGSPSTAAILAAIGARLDTRKPSDRTGGSA